MKPNPKLIALIAGTCLMLGCASQQPLREMAPGERPPENTDEAGLWTALDEAEFSLQRSPLRIHDPALNAYVKKMVCDLAGEYCKDIRVYIIRRPYFNASMAPNGVMQIWTGALLRSENEAQIAAALLRLKARMAVVVIGHHGSLPALADYTIQLERGRCVRSGSARKPPEGVRDET